MASYARRFSVGKDAEQGEQPRRAVALGYAEGIDAAPRVLASGQGLIAERIVELARQNGIPIHEDAILTAALSTIELDEAIPPALYQVVAEIFAYIYRVQQRRLSTR